MMRYTAVIALLPFIQSCAILDLNSDPKEVYLSLQETLIVGIEIVMDLREIGVIEEEEFDEIYRPIIEEISRYLDEMETTIVSGDSEKFAMLRSAIVIGLKRLQMERLNHGD